MLRVEPKQKPLPAVAGMVHDVAGLLQPLADEAGGFRIVFDEENAHARDSATADAGRKLPEHRGRIADEFGVGG